MIPIMRGVILGFGTQSKELPDGTWHEYPIVLIRTDNGMCKANRDSFAKNVKIQPGDKFILVYDVIGFYWLPDPDDDC